MSSGSIGQDNTGSSSTQHITGTVGTESTFDPATKAILDSVLSNKDYSKEAAIADSKGAVDYTVKSALEAGAPQISSADKASGGYNSTTTQMLNDDLTARSAAAGQKVLLDTITGYANANANQVQAVTGATSVTKGTKVTTDMLTNGAANSKSTSAKFGFDNNAALAAGGGTVICTQLHRDGILSTRHFHADARYVRNHFSAATINGYRFWAVPFVMLMRRNRTIYAIGRYFGTRWSLHMASHYCPELAPNWTGRLLISIMVPVCFCIGTVIPEVEHYEMWKGS